MGLDEAIVQGTRDRVRPVIMTKLTAILGMLVIAGLIFHTLVTLIPPRDTREVNFPKL